MNTNAVETQHDKEAFALLIIWKGTGQFVISAELLEELSGRVSAKGGPKVPPLHMCTYV